jgi:two-component system, NtrC family, response regulator AtoC
MARCVATQRIAPSAMAWLKSQSWPGNIRELKNRIECACLLCGNGPIEIKHLAPDSAGGPEPGKAPAPTLWREFESIERQRILEALASCDGNQTRAAAKLGISRRTLINRLDEYGVERPRRKT